MAVVVGRDQTALKRVTCGKCASIIEYSRGEVRLLWSDTDYGGGPDGAEGFGCPNCGQNVIVRRW